MSEYYAMDDVAFKPQAYEKAARLIESLEDDLADIYKTGGVKGLMEIEGVGQSLAQKIRKLLKQDKDVFIYFNNDFQGFTIQNAQQLTRILGKL